jgi:hypothetical protein
VNIKLFDTSGATKGNRNVPPLYLNLDERWRSVVNITLRSLDTRGKMPPSIEVEAVNVSTAGMEAF